MKKIFLLLAFTGIVGAASATSLVTLTKGTVITFGGDDKKQDEKKKSKKKSCCKNKSAESSSACSGVKAGAEGKAGMKSPATVNHATAEVQEKGLEAATPAPASK